MVTDICSKTTLIVCLIIASLSESDSRKSSKTSLSVLLASKRSGVTKPKNNSTPKVVQMTSKSSANVTRKAYKKPGPTRNKDKKFNSHQNSFRRNGLTSEPDTVDEQIQMRVREPSRAEEIIAEHQIRFLATKSLTLENVTNDKMELLINKRLSCINEKTPPSEVNTDLWDAYSTMVDINLENERFINNTSVPGRRLGSYHNEIWEHDKKKKAEATKIMLLMQQWIFMAQERIKHLQGVIDTRKSSVRLKMGLIFRHLDELIFQIRVAWTFMRRHWRHPKYTNEFPQFFPAGELQSREASKKDILSASWGVVRMYHFIMYYISVIRRYIDIVYLTDRLAMVFERYYNIKMKLIQEYFPSQSQGKGKGKKDNNNKKGKKG